MNILEEIQNCSVEWKELGEVCSVKKGKQLNKNLLTEDGSYPAYNGGQTYSGRTNDYNVEANTIIVSQGGASAGFVNFVDTKFWANAHCYYILPDETRVNNRFVYHFVKMNQKYLMYFQHGAGIPALKSDKLTKLLIPIPPLKIQEKIAQILDKFTDYVTELTSRKKQYSFYRDKLLSFEDEVYQVEWKTLDAVSERTSNISWNKIGDDEKFKYIDLSSVDRVSNKITETTSITKSTAPSRAQKIVKSNDIILGTTRPTLKRFTKITDDYNDQICSTGFYVFRTNGEVLPNYVYHIFSSSDFYKYLEENQSGASYPAISDALVKKYKIPVPSLEIQSRIVQVLDNFDKVCNDLNIGLPKEIELRQKQYEYFREKLLTFVAEGEYTESRVEEWDNSAIIKLLQWVFGSIRVKLGAMARYSKARIEATKLTSENYVGVDNLLQDRNGKTVATYLPEQGSFTGYDQDDILIGNIRPYLKKIWYANQSGGTNGDVLVIQNLFPSCLESQYLYYVLSDDRFFSYDMQYAKGSKMPRGDKAAIMQYSFILPSLSEQERIVSILDNFNTLTNSLSEGLPKEIELRQKQYEYWREQLLNFTR
ncbi:restriction endonuclease subunit S [Streptococcus sp.]|uniref:restriction endonuclease subunit S n=1 Tax=Streptococcus sp. TaxID=1306 RepID=UPI0025AED39D|nr:restriction endonuclease subunit S [Streptococcus sp.]MDN3291670.1 restriction endonuclease subunit S [Streptococcus sp.]